MSRILAPTRVSSCICGRVKCRAIGAPIVSLVCYCDDCQRGAREIEALSNAAAFRDADGGTPLLAYRDDRFHCSDGEDLLVSHKLSEGAPTRRVAASCCNSAMFLKYAPGFWTSAYRARFAGDLPPPDMRIQIEHRRADSPIPRDAPCCRGLPMRLYAKMIAARFSMLLGR
jgi:hypothetical protein